MEEVITDTVGAVDRVVALNPRLWMRKNADRIYIYPRNPFLHQGMDRRVEISSAEAIVIALFDGKKTVRMVADDVAAIAGIDQNISETLVTNCLKVFEKYLVPVDATNALAIIEYEPLDFVVEKGASSEPVRISTEPEQVIFIPTFRCRFDCRYCYAPRNLACCELTISEIGKLVNDLAVWHIPSVVFSGGDPFCHDRIGEIIGIFAEKNIKPVLATKTPLTKDLIEILKKNNITELQISIDSTEPEVLETIVGVDDYFERIRDSIRALIAEGVIVYTNSILTSFSIRGVDKLIEDLTAWGVQQITLSQYSRSRFCHDDQIFCTPDEIDRLEMRLQERGGSNIIFKKMRDPVYMTLDQRNDFFERRPMCNAGRNGFVVLPDGLVTICENLYYEPAFIIGDIRQQSVHELWQSDRLKTILEEAYANRLNATCRTCPTLRLCRRGSGKCHVRALQAFGTPTGPDPYCPRSDAGKRFI